MPIPIQLFLAYPVSLYSLYAYTYSVVSLKPAAYSLLYMPTVHVASIHAVAAL